MSYPIISEDPRVQTHYEACRKKGTAHSLAEMFALASPPMSNTDREFLEGRGGCYDQFQGNEFLGNYYASQAKRHGVDTTGKVYLSGLAAYPGDPKAWVTGRGDAQKVLEERGWGSRGSVEVKAREVEPERVGLAPDLIREKVLDRLEDLPAPERTARKVEEIRAEVVERHTPYWAKPATPTGTATGSEVACG